MSLDEDTPRYLGGFRDAVKRLLGPKVGWSTTYTDAAAYAQAIARAYQAGRLDGIAEGMGPVAAPGPVDIEPETPRETPLEVVERLGLFLAPTEPPEHAVVTLVVLDGADPYVWAVRQAREVLGLSLAEAEDYVGGVLG